MIELLASFTFFASLAVGAVCLELLWRLTGGSWGREVRPVLKRTAGLIPLIAPATIPLGLGLEALYPWADHLEVLRDPILRHREVWMNPDLFVVRSVAYLGVFAVLGWFVANKESRSWAGPLLALHFTVSTWAAFDWLMTLEVHFYSTIFGGFYILNGATSCLALAILRTGSGKGKAVHDRGKLLLAAVMLQAYLVFSQLLIVWTANLPHEVTWYLTRLYGPWWPLALTLFLAYFAFPFLYLLFARNRTENLRPAAGVVLFCGWLYQLWLVLPAHYPHELVLKPINGLWLLLFGGVTYLSIREKS